MLESRTVHGGTFPPGSRYPGAAATGFRIQLGASLAGSAENPIRLKASPPSAGWGLIPITRGGPLRRPRVGRECAANLAPPRVVSRLPGRFFHNPQSDAANRFEVPAHIRTFNFSRTVTRQDRRPRDLELHLSAVPLATKVRRGGFRNVEKVGVVCV